jgi:hypothetical protein
MLAKAILSDQAFAGWLLILSAIIFCAGGMLYTGRAIWKWSAGQTHTYLVLERGFVITALLVAVLGFNLLERMLEAAGDRIMAPSGMALLLIAAAVVTVGETFFISRQGWIYASFVVFVILAFLAEALFGGSLLHTGLLPAWIGWGVILWNLGWLVILPVAKPSDMYYPWLHYIAPLVIGIGLLAFARGALKIL